MQRSNQRKVCGVEEAIEKTNLLCQVPFLNEKAKINNLGFRCVLEMGLEPIRTNVHWILSPTCLPIPPLERFLQNFRKGLDSNKKTLTSSVFFERKKGFEPSTSTLAR